MAGVAVVRGAHDGPNGAAGMQRTVMNERPAVWTEGARRVGVDWGLKSE